MPRSRTIISLSALLAAMTVGTFALLLLAPTPIGPGSVAVLAARRVQSGPTKSAIREIRDTKIPIQADKWLNIVVHDGVCDHGAEPETACHFIVRDDEASSQEPAIQATSRWRRQMDGTHVNIGGHDYNATSIGICVAGEFPSSGLTASEFKNLRALVRSLQQRFQISRQYVYLHHDLTGSPCPGESFPVREFRSALLDDAR